MRFGFLSSLAIAAGLLIASPAALATSDTAAAAPLPAQVVESFDGPVFVTPEGRSLYFYGGDIKSNESACSSKPTITMNDPSSGFGQFKLPGYRYVRSCAQANPPYLADANARPQGDWTLLQRPEGTKQWVYRGRPLYMSSRDQKPGDRNGAARDQGGRGGLRLASAPVNLPSGLEMIRVGEEVVLAGADRRPLYTPRGGRLQKACKGCEEDFRPLTAAALSKVLGDWSVIGGQSGSLQYAYRGKPLYLQPQGMTYRDIEEAGQWEMVVVQKGPGLPAAINTRYSPVLGDIYTTRSGHSLYIYTCTSPGCDQPGGPAAYLAALCGSECAQRWRPYLAAPGAKPVGEWSIVEVADPLFTDPAGVLYPPEVPRVKAWAFQGRPLFTFHEDRDPGNIWGHSMRWFSMSNFTALIVPGREAAY